MDWAPSYEGAQGNAQPSYHKPRAGGTMAGTRGGKKGRKAGRQYRYGGLSQSVSHYRQRRALNVPRGGNGGAWRAGSNRPQRSWAEVAGL